MSFYPWIISCHHVSIDGMFVIYGMPTTLIDTSYSYIMSSCLHSHHILKYVILPCLVSHHWNYVLLFCLLRQHKCELFHALFSSLLYIAPIYLTMFVHSITFLVYQPFQLEGVMAVSVGVKTRSLEKIVLPVDADRTTVVLAQEPAPPHITQTHADCTPTQLDREPATPLLTPT